MTKPRKHEIVGMSSFLRALESTPKILNSKQLRKEQKKFIRQMKLA